MAPRVAARSVTQLPLTPLAGEVVELAADQARKFKDSTIGQEHLLLALRVLARLGCDPAAIRNLLRS